MSGPTRSSPGPTGRKAALASIHPAWWVGAVLAVPIVSAISFVTSGLYALDLHERRVEASFEDISRSYFMEARQYQLAGRGGDATVSDLADGFAKRFSTDAFGAGATFSLLPPEAAHAWLMANGASPRNQFVPPRPMKGTNDPRVWQYLYRFRAPPLRTEPWRGRPDPSTPRRKPPTLSALVTIPKWPVLAGPSALSAGILAVLGAIVGGLAYSLRVFVRAIDSELALARNKANFTAMVSHELRTPITAIRMNAEALRDGLITDPSKRDVFIDRVAREAMRLQRLIENLLALGRVERGAQRYRLQPERPAELVREALESARSVHLDLVDLVLIRIPADTPDVLADREAAVQAIGNLVMNAIKYGGSPSHVAITASISGGEVLIEVQDRGPGIPQEFRKAVFDPYVRLGDEQTRTSQGIGLGLALVQAYMVGQGGRVELRDRQGGGSIFALAFQIAATREEDEKSPDRRG